MKRTMILMLTCVLLLAGCGKNNTQAAAHFSVMGSEAEICLDAPATPILEMLGAPFGYGVQESSRVKGVEKVYRYPGIELKTYPSEDGERVLTVLLKDSTLSTTEGICVGSTAAEVRQCYGENAIHDGRCTLRKNNEAMVLMLTNNIVTSIQYSLM